jgi:hypothetical protein
MPYGYTGQNLINQTKKNSGVFSISDVASLEKQGKFGGSLEHIITSTASSSAVEFVDKFAYFDIFKIQLINCVPSTQTEFGIQFSNDSGTSYETSNYEFSNRRGFANNTFELRTSQSQSSIRLGGDVETSDNLNSTIYIYNANDASDYTYITQYSVFKGTSGGGGFGFEQGGGLYGVAEVVNGIKIGEGTAVSAFTSGTVKLYGIKKR